MTNFKMLAAVALATLVALPVLPANAQRKPYDNYPEGVSTTCGSEIGFMRRVYASEVADVEDDNNVWVTELCPGEEMGALRNEGNAGKLRGAIADNEVIMDKLERRGYTEDDVLAVRMMGEDTINLYVYHYQN